MIIDMKYILDIGCGNNKYKGNFDDIVMGMDIFDLKPVNVIHNMESFPYPFPSQYFDRIIMKNVIEHISRENMVNIKLMEEVYRLLKPDGIFVASTCNGQMFYDDPNHKNPVYFNYWNFFREDYALNYYSTSRFKMGEHKILSLNGIRYINILKPIFSWLYIKNPTSTERILDFLHIDYEVEYILRKV